MARPREFDEAHVVQSAMELFWTKGYQSASVQDLVDATGLRRGSIYGAFHDKHGIFVAALDAYAELMLGRIQALVESSEDPVDAVRQFVRDAGVNSEHPEHSQRGCFIGNTCSELAPHDDLVRDRAAAFAAAMQRTMSDALRRGRELGTFAADRDPDAVATFIQCALQGLALLAKSRPGADVLRGVVDEILRALD